LLGILESKFLFLTQAQASFSGTVFLLFLKFCCCWENIDINIIYDSLGKNADQDSAAPDSGPGFAINTLYDLERATVVL